jgi:hypothetical protein
MSKATSEQISHARPDPEELEESYTELAKLVWGKNNQRNIPMATVDERGDAHPYLVGGAAVGADLSITTWSWRHTQHAGYYRAGRFMSALFCSTGDNIKALRAKRMTVEEIPPEHAAQHLQDLNAARKRFEIPPRELGEFLDPERKRLYVARLSSDPADTTVSVRGFYEGEWVTDLQWPIELSKLQSAAGQLGVQSAENAH